MTTTSYSETAVQNGVPTTYTASSVVNGATVAERPGLRRVQGLRFPVLPSGALLAQLLGAVAVLVGIYLAAALLGGVQAGLAATLITGGVAAVVLGMLREAGKV